MTRSAPVSPRPAPRSSPARPSPGLAEGLAVHPSVFVLLALTALAVAPLTAPGYFMLAHDARHTVYFMQMFDAALRAGALYPRWAADMVFGYGYPVWLILAPLPYYLAEAFHLTGLDFPSSIKAVEAVAWFGSALGMYLFARRLLGREGALVAAVAYVFVPYHVVDLYVRGAMAEFLAFVFPPLILLALYDLAAGPGRARAFVLAAAAYAALILTHISMAVLFSPVLFGFILVLHRWSPAHREGAPEEPGYGSSIVIPFLALASGLALSAVFLLPVVLEQRYLTSEPLIGGFFDFRLHFLNPSQLVSPLWGYGYAGINGTDQFSLQLGIVPLALAAFALLSLRRHTAARVPLLYLTLVLVVAVLAMFAFTTPLWELAAPVIAFAQFPWRLLFVTATALAVLAGVVVGLLPASDRLPGALLLSLLVALAMFPYVRPQYSDARFTWSTMMDFQVKDRELLGDTVWTDARPLDSPLVAQYRAGAITTKAVVTSGAGTVELVERGPLGDTVRVEAATPVRLMFYTRYFPGWTASVDGAPVAIAPEGEQGLIGLDVPQGSHVVVTRWGTTLPRVLGALVSLVTAAALVLVVASHGRLPAVLRRGRS